jgi:hypothetical protein
MRYASVMREGALATHTRNGGRVWQAAHRETFYGKGILLLLLDSYPLFFGLAPLALSARSGRIRQGIRSASSCGDDQELLSGSDCYFREG